MENKDSNKELCLRKKGFLIAGLGIFLQIIAFLTSLRLMNSSDYEVALARINEPGMILMGFGFLYAGYDEFKIRYPLLTKSLMIALPILFVILAVRTFR